MPVSDRQLKAIVFSDVVDSSVKIFADELIAIQRIKEDLTLIREELQRHGGSLVKSLGDGLLATFDGPTQALQFVQAAVQKLSARGVMPWLTASACTPARSMPMAMTSWARGYISLHACRR